MNTQKEIELPQGVPADMVEVDQAEFYRLLYADPRDIMPSARERLFTPWEVVRTRELWGWCSQGYASPYGTPKRWFVLRSVAAKGSAK